MEPLQFVARGLTGARLSAGGNASLNRVAETIASAERGVVLEAFRLQDPGVLDALRERLAAGVSVEVLGDPRNFDGLIRRTELEALGAQYVPAGVHPDKLHAKAVTVDDARAVVTTAAFSSGSRRWIDFAAAVTGDAARAVGAMTVAAEAADRAAVRAGAVVAADLGILLNDARFGVDVLRAQLLRMVDGAERHVTIAAKRYEDPEVMAAVARAAERGVAVDTHVHPRNWHANVVVADDQTYFGSAHLTAGRLSGTGADGIQARELGVYVELPHIAAWMRKIVATHT